MLRRTERLGMPGMEVILLGISAEKRRRAVSKVKVGIMEGGG